MMRHWVKTVDLQLLWSGPLLKSCQSYGTLPFSLAVFVKYSRPYQFDQRSDF